MLVIVSIGFILFPFSFACCSIKPTVAIDGVVMVTTGTTSPQMLHHR